MCVLILLPFFLGMAKVHDIGSTNSPNYQAGHEPPKKVSNHKCIALLF